jgi:hypothetical protein
MTDVVTPQQFTGDITSQVEQWIAAALAGAPAYLPGGFDYVMTRPLRIAMNAQPTLGAKFYGDTVARSKIDLRAITDQVPLLITCDTTWSPDGKGDNYWLKFEDIGILANYAGPAVQFGRDDYRDPVNAPEISIQVQNFSTSSLASAIRLNYVLGGKLRLICNVAGPGYALDCRQAGFNVIEGSFSAIGGLGIVLRDGFNTGNQFSAPDIENVFCCFRVFNQQSVGNTLVGGTYSYTSSGVFATAGVSNVLLNPQANPVAPATLSGFRGSMTGISIIGGNA